MAPEFKPGAVIKYRNYGDIRTGKIERLIGKNQLYVVRMDGPLIGSTAWIHRDSIVEVDGASYPPTKDREYDWRNG